MHRLLAAHLAAGQLDGAVRDDFVDVHVGLRAAARLPDVVERELVGVLPGDDLVGRLDQQRRLVRRELAQLLVDPGRPPS